MKAFLCLLLVAIARASPVIEVIAPVAVAASSTAAPIPAHVDEVSVEQNSQDPSALLSEPIDKATKLIIDLDEHLRKYLPAEEEVAITTAAPAQVYAGSDVVVEEAELSVVERQNQMTQLIDQVNSLAENIENTITDLVSRRRYVTAAMLRSMLNYVRRVRINLERLQNRLQSVQAVATSGQSAPATAGSPSVPVNGPGTAFFTTIRDRVNRITEEIGALVSRIRGSFTPGLPAPAVPGGPLAPLSVTGSPGVPNAQGLIAAIGNGAQDIAAAAAAVGQM
jgi:ribosomal protein S15P/S13E